MPELDDDELLDALGVEVAPLKASSRTPREERIMAGFEEILRFHQAHGRAPLHGEGREIFERLYAVRLDQLRKLPEAQALLAGMDRPGLFQCWYRARNAAFCERQPSVPVPLAQTAVGTCQNPHKACGRQFPLPLAFQR